MSSKVGTSDTSSVELHKRERTQYMGHPGICTVTFCSGDPQTTFSSLKAKTLEVLTANPWIGGTFDKKKDLVFSSSPTSEDCDFIVSICKNAKVNRALPYPRLVAAVAKDASMSVGTGGALRSSGARITKLVVVEPEAAGGEFAIVFSMSHAAADGHDYYRIFNMICSTDPVDSLTPVRVAEYERRESEWTGKKDFDFLTSGGLIKGMLSGLLFGPKAAWACYKVDASKVEAAKAASVRGAANLGAKGVEFVSTNDVLTSHFCRATQARLCMMVVNFRDKTDLDISDKNAGCYEGCLLLDKENYADPACIRASLSAGLPYTRQIPSPPLPGFCGSCPMAFITSWANGAVAGGRFNAANVDGVTAQALHLPCMDMPDMMDVS
ncbi:hypothetical protein TeGR_g12281 [Tetraparma gracilis]|uniref:Uncharacterized protein n=1 Tax=Tetraparma gracilis TaxID=2962635 RepID=A0ABQ6MY22_9STRA|nr:hypothetical protein TeGR_g12281 [Tetraparma gracilis]